MRELGTQSPELHAALADDIVEAGFHLVLAAGPMMRALADALHGRIAVEWREAAAGLRPVVLEAVRAGDVVVVKGSNGSRMASIVAALKERHDHVKASPVDPGAAAPHHDLAPVGPAA